MRAIKPIETHWKGYRFRSRLEARWAVFFETLGIAWEYEVEGFEWTANDGTIRRYLPDFYLPELETWVEVKGSESQLDYEFLSELIADGGHLPGVEDSFYVGSTCGLLLLGPIPDTSNETRWPMHSVLQHNERSMEVFCQFNDRPPGMMVPISPITMIDKTCDEIGCNGEHKFPLFYCHLDKGGSGPTWHNLLAERYQLKRIPDRVAKAYRAARGARFEHGEEPGTVS